MKNGNGQKHRRNTAGLKPPWPKGTSGNPGGRPKGRTVWARIRELLDENDGEKRERVAEAFIAMAEGGSIAHAKEVIEREEGKVPDDGTVRVVIEYTDARDPADDETAARRTAACN